jgi:hypothetical protein
MNKIRYLLPGDSVPENATMKNGDPMKVTMIGAYYGSSAEVEASYSITSSNAGNQIAPAYSDLVDKFKNVPRKGEFAALKGESQILPETRFGEQIIEITSTEQAVKMKDDIRRFMAPNSLARQLSYTTSTGKKMSYDQLMLAYKQHATENKEVLAAKQQVIKDMGYETRFEDGKKVSPEYPDELLEKLADLSKGQWTTTGYNLRIHFKVRHTIAKDSKFYCGSLDQSQLDALAAQFDYKDHTSFWSGKLGRADIAVPVQSMEHIQMILDYVAAHHPIVDEWKALGDKVQLIRGVYVEN